MQRQLTRTSLKEWVKHYRSFFLWSIPITCLVGVVMFGIDKLDFPSRTSTPNDNEAVITPSKPFIQTYSGNCTQYKLTLVDGNKKKYTEVAHGMAKITIDYTAKKFTFIFKNKVVYSYKGFLNEKDNERVTESFSLGGDWSAIRANMQGTFTVHNSYFGTSPELGYEYEMTNYKLN
ncbi:MAG: hypothetical protein EOO90_21475 [Pedobacter sp.]|nr:MAG: hypothetical protein EOO90_21475 [Pedobacter sp.]